MSTQIDSDSLPFDERRLVISDSQRSASFSGADFTVFGFTPLEHISRNSRSYRLLVFQPLEMRSLSVFLAHLGLKSLVWAHVA